MFLRVKIREEDRDSLRFLWRNNMNENPQEYRMTSLIFGAASSPVLIYIKNRNASEFELEYPEACKAIRLDHYVDDFLKSFNSIEEARRVSKQVYEIHRKAAFELRGWASNEIEVLNEMPDTRNDDNVQLGATHELKTLGLQWDINNDALGFNLGLRNTPTEVLETSLPPTKRQVTSAVMSVFDPLEYLDAYRPATPRGVRRRERKVVRCGRVLAYKIERTRKRSFANSRKSSRRSLKVIDPSARVESGATERSIELV
ncbi:hypothetical protein EVAR_91802_1 [Eumeta japonica]|uniref:Reverse transcriptase domain-containing protein n=1 Tax=Eumeta variegata TaxID=151549 RepID=A0A4C1TI25_EUMVA|nr:hypothetical protein EVAR_91802_1 [Eumeta japonica]